jgi:hypothetical protein
MKLHSHSHTQFKAGDFVTLRRNHAIIGQIVYLSTSGKVRHTKERNSPNFYITAHVEFIWPHEEFLPKRPVYHLLLLPLSSEAKINLMIDNTFARNQARREAQSRKVIWRKGRKPLSRTTSPTPY